METAGKAIEAAYEKQIQSLYNTFMQAMLTANGNADQVMAAEQKFKRGLETVAAVHARALMLAVYTAS